MFKLLFTIVVFLALGLALLGMRQHRLELTAQAAQLSRQIPEREHELADLKVQIAQSTDPRRLADEIKASGIDLPLPMTSTTQAAHVGAEPSGDLVVVRRGVARPPAHR